MSLLFMRTGIACRKASPDYFSYPCRAVIIPLWEDQP